jgi:hypothetical protein
MVEMYGVFEEARKTETFLEVYVHLKVEKRSWGYLG